MANFRQDPVAERFFRLHIFSGMKIGAILAVAGAIVGEFLGSSRGLGYLMLQVQVTLDTAAMFMAVILITLIGALLYGLVDRT